MVDIHWFRLDPTKVKIWHKMQKKTVWGALAPSLVLTALLILFSHVTQLSCRKRQKKDVTTSETNVEQCLNQTEQSCAKVLVSRGY